MIATIDEQLALGRAITTLEETHGSPETLPPMEKEAWLKAYSLYEKLRREGESEK